MAFTTIGSGARSLVLRISQDAWLGDAQYRLSVDGVPVDGTLTASASHAAGGGAGSCRSAHLPGQRLGR